jgi:predicted nuclease of restriction endonuclease-like (RecB) superfamily
MSKPTVTRPRGTVAVDAAGILADLRELIHSARHRVATVANAEQTLLYWRLGKRIATENLTEGRTEYGKQILATVSQELMAEFGRGFTYTAIIRMIQFHQAFPDEQIVATLSPQLGWSHFIEILPIKTPLAREFYAEMCRVERWSVRTLRQKISGMLYERTALSKNTEAIIKAELENLRDGQMTPDMVFRDPYLLDFLGLQGAFSEKDLENAILREMERFLLELGSGFSFVARQKRMSVGKDDFYLDLLFYHRFLRRLVAIELKLESFQPAHIGQMELYLRWLDKNDRAVGEESPIGLILCAGSDAEQVELLQLDEKSIRVAEYLTELPPVELLRSRLHLALELAREQAARRIGDGE